MTYISEYLFSYAVPIIVRPSPEFRIYQFDKIIHWKGYVLFDEFTQIALEHQRIGFTRLDEQFPFVLPMVEPKKVKAIVDMSNVRFLFG